MKKVKKKKNADRLGAGCLLMMIMTVCNLVAGFSVLLSCRMTPISEELLHVSSQSQPHVQLISNQLSIDNELSGLEFVRGSVLGLFLFL